MQQFITFYAPPPFPLVLHASEGKTLCAIINLTIAQFEFNKSITHSIKMKHSINCKIVIILQLRKSVGYFWGILLGIFGAFRWVFLG